MTRQRRLIILIATLLPLLAFLVAGVLFLVVQVQRTLQRIDVILVAELERQLQRDVEVGRVTVRPLGTLVVEDLHIAGRPDVDGDTFASADRVVVSYNIFDLILGRVAPIENISSVRVVRPSIFLQRDEEGQWNFRDLLEPRPPGPPFRGVVVVKDGVLTLRDYLTNLPQPPAVNRIVNLDGVFDAAEAPSYLFNIAAEGTQDRAGRIRVSGSGNTEANAWNIDIAAKEAAAAYWLPYFVDLGMIRPVAGRGDVSLSIAYRGERPPGRRITVEGAAEVQDVAVAVDRLREPVRQLSGTVAFSSSAVDLNVEGQFAESPISVSGAIIDFADPRLSIRIASDRMDYAALRNAIEMPEDLQDVQLYGIGPLTVSLIGDAASPIAQVNASIPTASAFGYTARDVDATLTYQDGLIRTPQVTATAFGGRVIVTGSIGWDPAVTFDLSGRATGISLAALPLPEEVDAQGTASGSFSVAGTLERPRVALDVQVGRGILNTLVFSQASGSLVWTPQRIQIDAFTVATADGVLRAQGIITQEQLRLNVSAAGIDLAALLGQFGIPGYEGRAYALGVVAGPVADPTFTGRAEIFNARFGQMAFDYVRGRLVATRDEVALTDTVVRVFPSEILVTGRIFGIATDQVEVDLTLQVSEAQAVQVLRLLQITADVTGFVSGTLRVVGPPPRVVVTGEVALRDGSIMGFPITTAVAAIDYREGAVTIRNAVARMDGATAVAGGGVDDEGRLDLQFSVSELALAHVNRFARPYVTLGGTVEIITGSVTGTFDLPVVTFAARADDIAINTERFSTLNVSGVWQPDFIGVSQLALIRNGEQFAIEQLSVNQVTETVELTGNLSRVNISTLLDTFYGSPYVAEMLAEPPDSERGVIIRNFTANLPRPTEGIMDLAFSGAGQISRPNVSVSGVIGDLVLGETQIERVELALHSIDGTIVLDDFQAIAMDADIRIEPGVVFADGMLDVDISATNIDARIVGAAIGRPEVSGIAAVDASIQGPVASPRIIGSVEIAEPEIAGIAFDRIRASRIEVGADIIEISDVIFTSDGYRVVLYGTVPWSWEELRIPLDRPLNIHAALVEQDLDILALLIPGVVAEQTGGQVEAVVDLTGTIAEPELGGHFTITDGSIGFEGVTTPIEEIQARIDFIGDRLIVQQFSGRSAAGGTFAVLPGGEVFLGGVDGPQIDLGVETEGLAIRARNVFGYGESLALTIDSELTVSGMPASPLIAGDVEIRSSSLAISPPPILPEPDFDPAFNPAFDIRVNLGRDVEFLNPRIRATIVGGATVRGTLAEPVVQGDIQVARGEIRLPTARFRIQPGSMVTLDYAPPDRVRIAPIIEGRTRMTALSPLGITRQYTIVISVSGTLPPAENLRIDLRSDPPDLPQSQILALLGHAEDLFRDGEIALRDELADIFAAIAMPSLFDPIETAFLEVFGLTEFEIEYSLRQPLAFLAAREIAPNLYLSYWRSMTAQEVDYWIKLSYEVFGRYRLSYISAPRVGATVEAGASFRF